MVFLIANNPYIMKSNLRKHAFNVGNKTYIKSMNRTPYVFRTYYQTLYMCFEKKSYMVRETCVLPFLTKFVLLTYCNPYIKFVFREACV